jgi:hypothetical protein
MKMFLTGFALLASVSSGQAAPAAALSDAMTQHSNPTTCTKVLTKTLSTTFFLLSEEAQNGFRNRLDQYQSLVGQVRVNLARGESNVATFDRLNDEMTKDAGFSVYGMPVGSTVVDCVKENVSFNGSISEQRVQAAQAMNLILNLQKAVR